MLKKILRSTFILILIIFITFIFSREISNLHFLTKENDKILERIDTLEIQNDDYKDKIEAIKNDNKYIETIVREELGMIKKGEKIYKFDN